ncbi:hypothetical protein NECAME_11812 [Necator americanus]|uniref:Uncharacterized protein n=1 Tax=Necator americanus TaxID=51031 RepID=W2T2M1_NECAM|nr:hypothetical protein NECAME_11812 [Necator americanus]ETN76245.1 hypothetical protein NECAME_11812 [Necator americanus]
MVEKIEAEKKQLAEEIHTLTRFRESMCNFRGHLSRRKYKKNSDSFHLPWKQHQKAIAQIHYSQQHTDIA